MPRFTWLPKSNCCHAGAVLLSLALMTPGLALEPERLDAAAPGPTASQQGGHSAARAPSVQSPMALERAAVPGGELEYEARGAGEPVLLIHGAHVAGSFVTVMDEPALAGYGLIRYHRRGYAGSTSAEGEPRHWIQTAAADAAALLRYLGVERAHVVGHSSGALIALQLALDAPEHVHSLLLLEPPRVAGSGAADGREARGPLVDRYFEGDSAGAVDAFMRTVVSEQWRREVGARIPGGVEQAERDAATFFEFELPAARSWPFDARAAQRIARPVLNVVGSESGSTFHDASRLIGTWLPETEDFIVPGVGHALHMQAPAAVAAGIAGFLARHPIDP